MGLYHRENAQEDFLVLAGECLLLVEGEERKLKTWDFFHCPPGTEHIIVGAGKEPAVVLAVGARGRRRKGLVYPVSKAALKHKAGVEQETTDPSEAYGGFETGSAPSTRKAGYPTCSHSRQVGKIGRRRPAPPAGRPTRDQRAGTCSMPCATPA